jgi:hypothetical protein
MASLIYHDSFWYQFKGKKKMQSVLESDWRHLFANWEQIEPDEQGYAISGDRVANIELTGIKAFWRSLAVLRTRIREAPEFILREKTNLNGREIQEK